MAWRDTARWYGAALTVLSFSVVGAVRPASAQEIERTIAGVRLGAKGTTILAKYGNPNQVVIGDIGVRQSPLSGGGAGSSPAEPGNEGGLPGFPGAPGFPGGGGRGGIQGGRATPGMAPGGAMDGPGQFGGPGGQMTGVPGAGEKEGGQGQFGGSSSLARRFRRWPMSRKSPGFTTARLATMSSRTNS